MSNIPEACVIPHREGWFKRNYAISFYELYALMGDTQAQQIIDQQPRPPQCGKCTMCVPEVFRGDSFGQKVLVVRPNTDSVE